MLPGKRIGLLFAFLISFLSQAQIYNSEIEASLKVVSNGEIYQITGSATNKTNIISSIRYVMSMNRRDSLGNDSRGERNGLLTLEPGDRKQLAQVSIGTSETDRIIALLLIYDNDDKIIGKDRVVFNGEDNNKELLERLIEVNTDPTEQVGEEEYVIRGLLFDRTITKPGRDFFNMFQSEYRNKDINGERAITVTEVLALGTNTKVQVKADYDLIFQFFVNPRSDIMERAAQQAVKRADLYFKRLERNRQLQQNN